MPLTLLLLALQSAPQPAPTWSAEIRPLLAEHCLACHGPDEDTRAADLRLDVREGLARVVAPGDLAASELFYRVSPEAAGDRMPPRGHGEPLAPDQVDLLRRWIEGGAVWTPHWAYAPFGEVTVPDVAHEGWARGPLDHFVLARLQREGLAPASEAEPRTLLRRVHLDLTGLPPTEDELAAFLADVRPDAYERRVDELLASVHFAERFARHWLDLARYADSNGFTIDGGRSIWPWRDWVVASIDADQPFDAFTIEQLAGDLLPDATRAQRLATGFHRNTQVNEEGGADDEENRVAAILDRVQTTGAVWLGATLGCAQCHTHKFDPVSNTEFYRFYAFFDQTEDSGVSLEPTLLVARDDAEEVAASVWERELARLERAHAAAHDDAHGEQAAGWRTWQPARAWASNGAKLRPEVDGSYSAVGQNAVFSTYVLEGASGAANVTQLRLEALPRRGLPGGGPGRSSNGNFVLQAVHLFTRDAPDAAWRPIPLQGAVADFEQDTTADGGGAYPASSVLTDVVPDAPRRGWAVRPAFGTPHALQLDLAQPLSLAAEAELRLELVQEHGARHTLGSFRVLARDAREDPARPAHAAQLVSPEWRTAWEALRQHEAGHPRLPTSLVLARRAAPRTTRVFHRGSFLDPRAVVTPGVPVILDQFREQPSGDDVVRGTQSTELTRLDLARWLVDPRNALTHRVFVNRTWQHLFGRGLVATENDFGLRGARPTHPELLEWLAQDFVRGGLSRKHLVRTIVTSATYRQASQCDPALLERDPDNALLARQRRLRLEGEVLRDSMLLASGALDRTVGGPPVQPPQPDGVFDFTQSNRTWTPSEGGARFRRSLYTRIWRTAPFPFYATFDAPAANATCTRRDASTSPLQALALANDPMTMELAALLGERLRGLWSLSDRQRISRAVEWCLARPARDEEIDVLLEHMESVADVRGSAAAWTAVGRVLFSLEEFRHRP